MTPLTPFRLRRNGHVADAALGWVIFWELMASSSLTQESVVAATSDVVQGCVDYLASPALVGSDQVRTCNRRWLGQATGETTEHN